MRVEHVLEDLRGLEGEDPAGRDRDGSAGLWVAPDALLLVADDEVAEARDLDLTHVDHVGTDAAGRKESAKLGCVGFQHAVKRRADRQLSDIPLHPVQPCLCGFLPGLSGLQGVLGGETFF